MDLAPVAVAVSHAGQPDAPCLLLPSPDFGQSHRTELLGEGQPKIAFQGTWSVGCCAKAALLHTTHPDQLPSQPALTPFKTSAGNRRPARPHRLA